jgi:hypothetical protein
MDIQSSGQFSRIFIQTQIASGEIGYFLFFRGPASVLATIFDYQNGMYEAIALLVEVK